MNRSRPAAFVIMASPTVSAPPRRLMQDSPYVHLDFGRPIRSTVVALVVLLHLGFLAMVLDLERFPLIQGRMPSGPTRLAVSDRLSSAAAIPPVLEGGPGGNILERYRMFGSVTVLAVEDGYLFRLDRGEFEAHIAWMDLSGRSQLELEPFNERPLRNVVAIATDGRNALFICGLAHLRDTGAIHRFVLDGEWKLLDTLPLPDCPTSVVLERNGTLRIATQSKADFLYRGE